MSATNDYAVCDSCMDAVNDETPLQLTHDEAVEAAVTMGASLADHICDDPDTCECGCQS